MDVPTRSRAPVAVLIAVAIRLYRDGLAATLRAFGSIDVAGTAGTSQEALAAARSLQPEVVLVDSSLEDALELIRALRAECPAARVLAFAVREDIAAILSYAEAGAEGFVTVDGSVAELVSAIESTRKGELLCSPRIAAQLLRQAARRSDGPVGAVSTTLTGRERQVLAYLRQGRSNKEIASSLSIAEATVKNHVHHVLEKLRVSTRGKAASLRLNLSA